jgi:hypothetical protein
MAEPRSADLAEVVISGKIPVEKLGLLRHQLGQLMSEHSLEVITLPETSNDEPWKYFLEKGYISADTPEGSTAPIYSVEWENIRLFFRDNSTIDSQQVQNSWRQLGNHYTFEHRFGGRSNPACSCPLHSVTGESGAYSPQSLVELGTKLAAQDPKLIKGDFRGHITQRIIIEYSDALLSQLPEGNA